MPIIVKSILCGLAAFALCAVAAPTQAGEVSVDVVFSDGEASIIRAHYRDHDGPRAGSGKGKKRLPAGIAKNLQRGKRLPPGIARQPLPADLADRLPTPPNGFERIVLSGKVLLVEIATEVVHDVLEDVMLGR